MLRVVTSEKTPVSPKAVRFQREQLQLSQRELGRRVAERMGRAEAARAFQVRLSRLEQGDEMSDEDLGWIDALAAELAVGTGDLAEPPVYIWITLAAGTPRIVELAMRMPCWTTPELAFQGRDWLAHSSNGHFLPFANGHLVPMRRRALAIETLDVNFPDLNERERQFLIAVDPDPEGALAYMAALNEVLSIDVVEEWQFAAIVESIVRFGLIGEMLQLHDLALRRLTHVPHDPSVLPAWRRREERLYEILERYHELRREQRGETLAAIPPEG